MTGTLRVSSGAAETALPRDHHSQTRQWCADASDIICLDPMRGEEIPLCPSQSRGLQFSGAKQQFRSSLSGIRLPQAADKMIPRHLPGVPASGVYRQLNATSSSSALRVYTALAAQSLLWTTA